MLYKINFLGFVRSNDNGNNHIKVFFNLNAEEVAAGDDSVLCGRRWWYIRWDFECNLPCFRPSFVVRLADALKGNSFVITAFYDLALDSSGQGSPVPNMRVVLCAGFEINL